MNLVSKVYLNDTGLQGAIKGKFSISGDEVDEVFPLMPHIQTIPVVGEHVLTAEYNGKLFYFSIINRKNSVNENSIPVDLPPDTKFGKTFFKKDIRHIEVNEGDVVYQPPEIHHREIKHSDDLELIEITSPAEFETISLADIR